MTGNEFDYLKLQYEEGIAAIKSWVDSRYKILQFIGYYNGAILTLGFGQKLILSNENYFAGNAICFLSLLVAIMGLATEVSNRKYNISYFDILRDIELKLNNNDTKPFLEKTGVFTYGKNNAKATLINKILALDRIHKIFYIVLICFWIFLLLFNILGYV